MKMSDRLLRFRTAKRQSTSKTAMSQIKDILAKRREEKQEAEEIKESTNPNSNMASVDYDFVSKRAEQRVLITIETRNGSFIDIEMDTTQLNTNSVHRALNAISAI